MWERATFLRHRPAVGQRVAHQRLPCHGLEILEVNESFFETALFRCLPGPHVCSMARLLIPITPLPHCRPQRTSFPHRSEAHLLSPRAILYLVEPLSMADPSAIHFPLSLEAARKSMPRMRSMMRMMVMSLTQKPSSWACRQILQLI